MKLRVETAFGTFADFTRLRVLHLLIHKELCVAGLVHSLGIAQPRVSQHLKVLRAAGLVSERRDGRWVFYSLTKPRSRLHTRILSCVETSHEDSDVLRRDCARMDKMLAAGGDLGGYRRIPLTPPGRSVAKRLIVR